MAFFSLDVRKARKGDCLLLHFGTQAAPHLALVDAGPASVYQPQLRPRLEQLRKARGLSPADGLPIDLMMVSHVDDDHIHGILELTRELSDAKQEHRPLPLRVLRLWHNSFDDILGTKPEELQASITAQFGAAALGGEVPEQPNIPHDVLGVLASVGQGHQLRTDAKKLGIKLNADFDGKLVMATGKPSAVKDLEGLSITVLGPLKDELAELQAEHDKWLKQSGKAKDSPEAALAAFSDESVANLSSIVALVKSGGKSLLLTGDARGDKVLKGAKQAGLLDAKGKLKVDVLKVPHHGSDRNVTRGFFEKILARHYVFSGNGEHGNPERTTLQMLLEARGSAEMDLHFTYPIDEIDKGRKADRQKAHKPWSAARDGLIAWLAETQASDAKVQIHVVPEGGKHVIDLLDPFPH